MTAANAIAPAEVIVEMLRTPRTIEELRVALGEPYSRRRTIENRVLGLYSVGRVTIANGLGHAKSPRVWIAVGGMDIR